MAPQSLSGADFGAGARAANDAADREVAHSGLRATAWSDGLSQFVRGEVETGDQRGRELGFPTANLSVEHLDIDEGVWAGWLTGPDDVTRLAAISVGRRSTIYGQRGSLLVEAHVLDFSGDLYGSIVTVELSGWLRPQRRFRSLSALKRQLVADVGASLDWAGHDRRDAVS
jgi:FAD synthase